MTRGKKLCGTFPVISLFLLHHGTNGESHSNDVTFFSGGDGEKWTDAWEKTTLRFVFHWGKTLCGTGKKLCGNFPVISLFC